MTMVKRRITTSDQPILRCSFCNKAQVEVGKLIAGPTVFICDECVQVCTDIIRAEKEASPTEVAPPAESHSSDATRIVTCKLCSLPLPLEDALLISERGFLCPGCSGEVEVSLAQKRENGT